MDIVINKELCARAIEVWGKSPQMNMVLEECMELAMAIHKIKNRTEKDGPQYDKRLLAVHDEAADVLIMMEQAKMILDPVVLQERVDFKLNRLKERLDKKQF